MHFPQLLERGHDCNESVNSDDENNRWMGSLAIEEQSDTEIEELSSPFKWGRWFKIDIFDSVLSRLAGGLC